MDKIPGENVTDQVRAERRRESMQDDRDLDLGRQTPPVCRSCGRPMVPGVRFSWTRDKDGILDGGQRCAACTGPNVPLEVFA